MSDHNDIRLQSIESDDGKPDSQVSDSSRHRAGSLQASDYVTRSVPGPTLSTVVVRRSALTVAGDRTTCHPAGCGDAMVATMNCEEC